MKLRKCVAVLAVALVATFATALAPGVVAAEPNVPEDAAPAVAAPRAVGPFQVRNQGVGRCMGFPYGDDRVRLWDCSDEAFLLWDLVSDGRGRHHLVSRRNGECFAGWAQGPNGWSTWVSTCDNTFSNPDQLWYVHPADHAGAGPISNLFGRVLEPEHGPGGGQQEARVEIWDNQGLPSRQWTLKYIQ
ncbi:RICIN domain-containing protein [Streptomyces sp. NPDC005728]|uniref:RICIN domain-containing protein n=1 Tax=Streptomyces sp. NPDC005728 TaxID=3157054 RepID=UPI0033E66830